MTISQQEVNSLINNEIESIDDPLIVSALRPILIEPEIREMDWNYGPEGQKYACWVVARDQTSDTEIVYCEDGFGPETPFGLVGISYNDMGMDSGWFASLVEAYCESFMAVYLAIWNVVEVSEIGAHKLISGPLKQDEAFTILWELRRGKSLAESAQYMVVRRDHQKR